MKHQPAINNQRLVNMKNGIQEAQRYIDSFGNLLEEKIKKNEVTLKDLDELYEIQSFLDWVKNQ